MAPKEALHLCVSSACAFSLAAGPCAAQQWTFEAIPIAYRCYEVTTSGPNVAFFDGEKGSGHACVFRTIDGGISWDAFPLNEGFNDICATDSLRIWAVSWYKIHYSSDGEEPGPCSTMAVRQLRRSPISKCSMTQLGSRSEMHRAVVQS